VALAKNAGLDIGEQGGIKVTPSLQTSDPAIYAVGDCVEGFNCITQKSEYWPLGGISTKMGRIAGDNIVGRQNEFCGSVNTAMFKIFDINVARTGLTLQKAQEYGFDPEAVTIASLDKAHYYEHAEYVVLKVIADKKTRVVLGAQGYGRGDVIAKIQLLACAVTQSLTLNDVFNLDLGYAPPFNTPVDLVQTACLVLSNKLDQLFKTITLEEFEQQKDHIAGIVDVSPLSEHTFHAIPGSINIPLENIRLEGIPFEKDENVILYSRTSSGAYQAYRYLITRGYAHLRVLEGGYVYWAK
jgi:rhodanese-related sulfurtransferase